jgi:hypothetical protein
MVTFRSSALQIGGNRVAHLDGHGQPIEARALAADYELSRAPVEIVETKPCHLAGTKTEAKQRDQHCVIPSSERRSSIAGRKQRARLSGLDPSGQEHPPSPGHGEGCTAEVDGNDPLGEAESEKGP